MNAASDVLPGYTASTVAFSNDHLITTPQYTYQDSLKAGVVVPEYVPSISTGNISNNPNITVEPVVEPCSKDHLVLQPIVS